MVSIVQQMPLGPYAVQGNVNSRNALASAHVSGMGSSTTSVHKAAKHHSGNSSTPSLVGAFPSKGVVIRM